MQSSKNIVIGAGPAGLAAGWELAKNSQNVLILEKDNQVGGMCRTINHQGYRFDVGGHRFFTKNEEVMRLWQETLGESFLTRSRLSRMYYQKKFFFYPIKPMDVLKKIGILEAVKILVSFLAGKIKLFPQRKKLETYRDWGVYNFGGRLFRTFFGDYNWKVWELSTREMSSEWYRQRIKGISLLGVLKTFIIPSSQNKIRSLVDEFFYPRFGPGMMYDRMASNIKLAKGDIKTNSALIKVKHSEGIITGVIYSQLEKQEEISLTQVDNFISTIPLTKLVRNFDPKPGQEVLAAIDRLKYRSFVSVCLIIDHPDLFPDNWIYVQEPEVKVARIQNFKNWSPDMVLDQSKTSLGMEYYCWQGDEFWNKKDEELVDFAANELKEIKLDKNAKLIGGTVIRVPDAYPVYSMGYKDDLKIILDYLAGFKNLFSISRAGMYRWNNMDHSILTGLYTARNIMGASLDINAINAEAEYHEEALSK